MNKSKKNIKKKKNKSKKENNRLKNILLKPKNQNIIYSILMIIDILLIIYAARRNYVNYAKVITEEKIFVGNTKNLLFGRNYIALIITFFFYIYILMCNKLLFNKKITKKNSLLTLIFLLVINITLFYIFAKRIY